MFNKQTLSIFGKCGILISLVLHWLTRDQTGHYYDHLEFFFIFYIGGFAFSKTTRRLLIHFNVWPNLGYIIFLNSTLYIILTLWGHDLESKNVLSWSSDRISEKDWVSRTFIMSFAFSELVIKFLSQKSFVAFFFLVGFIRDGIISLQKSRFFLSEKEKEDYDANDDGGEIEKDERLPPILFEEASCVICMEEMTTIPKEQRIVFKPCNHACVCAGCFIKWSIDYKKLHKNEKMKCFVCHQYIENKSFKVEVEDKNYVMILVPYTKEEERHDLNKKKKKLIEEIRQKIMQKIIDGDIK